MSSYMTQEEHFSLATLLLYCIVVPILIIVSVISCFVLLRAVAGHSLADCKHRAVRFIGGFRQQRPR